MNEYKPAYRFIGVLIGGLGGGAVVFAEIVNNALAFVSGILLIVVSALLIAGSSKGRIGRAARGIIEMINYIP